MVKQFCKRGHDTHVVGRTKQNYCRECYRAASRARSAEQREHRAALRTAKPKTHCRKGHEYASTGRYSDGRCKACVTIAKSRRRGAPVPGELKVFDDWDAPTHGTNGDRLTPETRYRLHERKFFQEVWGMSDPQVAEHLQVSPRLMFQIVKNAGLTWVPAPESEEVVV